MTDAVTIEALKSALREAILNTVRVRRRCIEYDPAGSTYEVDWTPDAKRWAALCDLDLEDREPMCYER